MREDLQGQLVAGAILAGVLWFAARRSRTVTAPATEPAPPAAMAIPGESQTLRAQIAGGNRDVAELTDLIFFARHPERRSAPITKAEPALSREWLYIRDTLVRPALEWSGTGGASGTF